MTEKQIIEKEKFLRFISGIDNLKSAGIGRIILGLVFILFGLLVWPLELTGDYPMISLGVAFFALGFTFIFDGLSILREYFKKKNEKTKRKN